MSRLTKYYEKCFVIKIVQLNRSCGIIIYCILQINCFYIFVSRFIATVMFMSLQFKQRNGDCYLKFKHYFSSDTKHRDNISFGSMTVKK